MKASKKIITSLFALPLLLGSVSAIAHGPKGMKDEQTHQTRIIKHLFDGVELTEAEVSQIHANMDALSKKPATLALHSEPSKEDKMASLIEGVNLTDAEKAQILANMDKRPQGGKGKGSKPDRNAPVAS